MVDRVREITTDSGNQVTLFAKGKPGLAGNLNPRWRGGERIRKDGRRLVYQPDHPRADSVGYVLGYILQAERALGKALPVGVVVHHLNGDTRIDANGNLVICENQAYHLYLHARLRAFQGCGNPSLRHCASCCQWMLPAMFDHAGRCKSCGRNRQRKFREENREYFNARQRGYMAKRRTGNATS